MLISSCQDDDESRSGIEKIVDFFNEIDVNRPVTISEIEDHTGLSWTYIKRILTKKLDQGYHGFNLKKSGSTWVAWKDRGKIVKKLDDTCGHLLREDEKG